MSFRAEGARDGTEPRVAHRGPSRPFGTAGWRRGDRPVAHSAGPLLGPQAEGRVDAPEEAAGHRRQELRLGEPLPRRQLPPGAKRQGVGHPGVALIRVILDEDVAPARAQVAEDAPQHRPLVALKVQGIGHDDAVQGRQVEGPRIVGGDIVHLHGGEAPLHLPLLLAQGAGDAIDGVNDAPRVDKVGQRQGKGARARTEIGPHSPGARDAPLQQIDVILVLHTLPRT